jgi:hypothetical protein
MGFYSSFIKNEANEPNEVMEIRAPDKCKTAKPM